MKKWKSRMVLGVVAITMALALGLFPGLAKATALTLGDVIALGSTGIQIDDKLFYNFSYIPSGGAPTAAQISFTPITTFGDPGFILNSLWSADSTGVADGFLTYNVRVLPGGSAITDVSAAFGGVGQVGTGLASLGENVFLGLDNTGANIANLNLLFNTSHNVLFQEVDLANPTFGPIFVVKDFGVVGGTNGSAQFSSVTNQFSEKVPEPISLILLGSGLAGAGLYRRLRKPKA